MQNNAKFTFNIFCKNAVQNVNIYNEAVRLLAIKGGLKLRKL